MTIPRTRVIIPARFASNRYPGKPLALVRGAGDEVRTLIERSWIAACSIPGVDSVWIATDDARIADVARGFGAQVVMTHENCANGTERCADALSGSGVFHPADIIVNFQGDALLTPPHIATRLIERMLAEPDLTVATPAVRCSPSLYRHLIEDQAAGRVGGTTVVFDQAGDALYFSKRVIPHLPSKYPIDGTLPVYLHLGIYAYRANALLQYATTPTCALEQLEGLEQLRFLEARIRIAAVICEQPAWDVIELNNPSDLLPIEAILKARGIA
jgi:3-deoxy-manno-octulosonate cytidylyltransferase (CMP-KDO synthetase)